MAIDYRKRVSRSALRSDLIPVRTVWDPGFDQQAAAVLTFRVGMADETVPIHGITHLVEHLVMRGSFGLDVECNASVGLTRTQFYASGPADQVELFLQRVNESLLRLPVEHLDSERDLISVEESHSRVRMPAGLYHFGAQRYGLVYFAQQLEHLQPQQILDWVRRYFTADNAVLALSGLDADRVRVTLPGGQSYAEPALHEITRPSRLHYVDPTHRTVELSSVVSASWHSAALAGVLNKALMDRIRHTEHLAYGVRAELLSIDLDHAMLTITSDCIPGKEQQLVDVLLDEMHRLSQVLPDDLIERSLRGLMARHGEDPQDTLLDRALVVLNRRGAPDAPSRFSALDQLSTHSLQQQIHEVLGNCVLRTPVAVQVPGWGIPDDLAACLKGTGSTYLSRSGQLLRLTSDGMALQSDETQQSLTWSSVVASFVADSDWTVISRLGVAIRLDLSQWDDPRVVEHLQDRVPQATRVPRSWNGVAQF